MSTCCQKIGTWSTVTWEKCMQGNFWNKFTIHSTINSFEINSRDDFGECLHTFSTEPFFYETVYKQNSVQGRLTIDCAKRSIVSVDSIPSSSEWMSYNSPIIIDEHGKPWLSKMIDSNSWQCSIVCRTLDTFHVEAIIDLKQSFNQRIEEVRENIETFDDGCPHNHHVKLWDSEDACMDVCKLGHPQPHIAGTCQSKLRMFRAASVHYPVLRKFLHHVYVATSCHNGVKCIDNA